MKSQEPPAVTRTIRRHELRQIVPLADTTIYEMEQRGEFPKRFFLTPRCVVWDLAEVEAWLDVCRQTRPSGARPYPSSSFEKHAPCSRSVIGRDASPHPPPGDRESMEHLASRNNRPKSDKIMPNRLKSALLASISVE